MHESDKGPANATSWSAGNQVGNLFLTGAHLLGGERGKAFGTHAGLLMKCTTFNGTQVVSRFLYSNIPDDIDKAFQSMGLLASTSMLLVLPCR
jgi:hypothetical protein